uniref:Putative secreted protein n=1 Tax=Ixodes ricinus TaxID=34613 RepID=A0A6B0U8E8_IXORI
MLLISAWRDTYPAAAAMFLKIFSCMQVALTAQVFHPLIWTKQCHHCHSQRAPTKFTNFHATLIRAKVKFDIFFWSDLWVPTNIKLEPYQDRY